MSDPVQSPEQPGSTSQRRPTKQERRAAADAAAAQAAASRARVQRVAGGTIGIVLAGLGVAAVVVLPQLMDGKPTSSTAPAASTSTEPAAEPTAPPAPTGAPESPEAPSRPEADLDPRLAQRPTVEAGSGELGKLTVDPLVEGTGPAVRAGQTITVNYVGVTYRDGKEFDASWNRGEPFPVQIGVGAVIPGWDQGLVGVKVGSRVQLDIPADLAYGENPSNGAPGGPLRFVVDVLSAQ
ncbi:FKBP-type peptidyl-prolyl cis-trans isomerase [Micromonospora sp. WMMD1102]|uniref:FKBP-type peptidyl-prolyl cis-trans isomerase n=1 Tax=Micromonospora sp. WMMD1102 TaxID=3016105 RepID=UPI0024152C09|nr:FKBP-type peptidyl-prolyl cis-trans isomerase [Micromonospora sp. WMMD1102]MDG4788131.1 FKBP-type peptidyl-prolyl cis-trans isomerase [Micromonospora sp. WMMD1102]